MKREIKFRVWTGLQMEYNIMAGFLGAFYVQGIDEKDSASMSPFNTKYPNDSPLMQFTGLKDKNGKEIYEWDIIAYENHEWVVTWVYDRWDMVNGDKGVREDDFSDDPGTTSWDWAEIIGNIYESPELFKDE